MAMSRQSMCRWIAGGVLLSLITGIGGCGPGKPPEYGIEQPIFFPLRKKQVWAVAPAFNLSGERQVDSILQADLLFEQLQQVQGLTVIPVNRVAEVYGVLKIDHIQSERQAMMVCDLLGCDGLMVPTITVYDPYDPPKLGAALQLFVKPPTSVKPTVRQASTAIHPRDMARQAAPAKGESLPAAQAPDPNFVQVVGIFDAANGSVRSALMRYASGRNDPVGPFGAKEYLVSMDRYCGFVYCSLISELINAPKLKRALE